MQTILEVLKQLAVDKNIVASFDEITDWYNSLDQVALETEIKNRFGVTLWDGVSPVNGLTAESIKAQPDFPQSADAKGFILYYNGLYYGFYYKTSNGQAITDANYQVEAEKIIDSMVASYKQMEITNRFLEQFSNKRLAVVAEQQHLDLMAALADIAVKLGVL